MLESIKANLWKGGLGFSKMFPVAGKVIGVSLPVKIMHEAFPKKKIKKILY